MDLATPRRKALAAFAVSLGSSIVLARTAAAQTKGGVADEVYPDDFGNISLDAGVAITAAFASGAKRVRLHSTNIYTCNTSFTVPDFCTLEGGLSSVGLATSTGYGPLGSQLKLGRGVTATIGVGANINRTLITRAGLALPATTLPAARALPATFSGIAVEFAGNDASIDDCIILGFNIAVSSSGYSRPKARRLRVDCTNGIVFEGGFDVGRITGCQAWPYTTVGVAPGGDRALRREGVAFKFKGACDWSSGENNFEYGYAIGFLRDACANITWDHCQADYTNPNNGSDGGLADTCGFQNINAVAYARDVNCTAIAQQTGIIHSSTLSNNLGGQLTISDGIYASSGNNILVDNVGGVDMTGNKFFSGTSALNVTTSSCTGVTIVGNYPAGVNPHVFIVPAGVPVTKIANVLDPANAAIDTLPDTILANLRVAPPRAAGSITIASSAHAPIGDGGPRLDFTGPAYGGDGATTKSVTYGGIRSYLVASSRSGSVTGLKLSVNYLDTQQDVLQIDHAGNITAGRYVGSQNYFGTPRAPWPVAVFTTLSAKNFSMPYGATPTVLAAGSLVFDGSNLYLGTGTGVCKFVPVSRS